MRVLGLGDNVFDVYENQKVAYPGGNAVNVAVNAARLGAKAAYLGNIADDTAGELMVAVLEKERVDLTRCQRPAGSTTKCCIESVINGERHWKRNELGDRWAGPLVLTENLVTYAALFDAVFTSCNAKIPREIAKLEGIPGVVVFDFGEKEKYRAPEYLGKVLAAVDIAQFSMSGLARDRVLEEVARMGIGCIVLITRGSEPPLLIAGDEIYEGMRNEGTIVDTMGAGDAFVTALVIELLGSGWHKGATLEADVAHRALDAAARHAREACSHTGAFGHPCRIVGGRFEKVS